MPYIAALKITYSLKSIVLFKTLLITVSTMISTNLYAQLPDYSSIVSRVSQCVVSISAVLDEMDAHPFTTPQETTVSPDTLSQLSEFINIQNIDHIHNGSGITYSEDGYIVTNNHIIQGASQILVRLANGLVFNASLVAANAHSDIAVLKIDSDNTPVCEMLDQESEIRAGQYILGFGSPYSLIGSVTEGIISYVNRPLPIMGVYKRDILYIQTDLEIAPGNSGGPIVNRDGEIIGINSLLLSSTNVTANIAFAIPIRLVRHIADDLISLGYATKGYIGVSVVDVPPDIESVRRLGLQTPTGAMISFIEEGGLAEQAGVQVGDIVVSVNHTVVKNQYEFNYEIALREEGNIIRLVIIRNGRYFSTEAIVTDVVME